MAPPRHERAGRAGAAGAATAARLRFSNAGCAGRRLAGTRGGLWCEGRSWRLLSERRRSAWSLRGAVSAPRRAAGPGSSGCRGAAGGGAVSVAPLPSAARWCASLRCGEAPGAAPEARGLLRGDEARPAPRGHGSAGLRAVAIGSPGERRERAWGGGAFRAAGRARSGRAAAGPRSAGLEVLLPASPCVGVVSVGSEYRCAAARAQAGRAAVPAMISAPEPPAGPLPPCRPRRWARR